MRHLEALSGRHNAHIQMLDLFQAHIVQAFQGGRLNDHRLLPDANSETPGVGSRIHQAMQLLSK